MRPEASERLIQDLARDVQPVIRVPRLRVVGGLVALVGAAAVALTVLASEGLRENLGSLLRTTPGFTATLAGLVLGALGGVAAALGASIPGRAGVERGGLTLLAVAALLALVAGPLLLLWQASGASPPFARDLDCLRGAWLTGFAPAAVVAWFVVRAAPHRPGLALGLGIAGAVALGALVRATTCPFAGTRHLLLGHAMAPLLAAVVVAPILVWLRRRRGPRS